MIRSLLKSWRELHGEYKAMLCSVVQWSGSVPRKDYPMMLVLDDGRILGTIGGGSMELKVNQAAQEMLSQNRSCLMEFDMTGRDVHADVGLCGGTLQVLIEPFTKELEDIFNSLLRDTPQRSKVMIHHHVIRDPLHIERRLISIVDDIMTEDKGIKQALVTAFKAQRTQAISTDDSLHLLWKAWSPPLIHIFGAGHVGQAVAELAHFNELTVSVHDDRQELLTPERFPYATRADLSFPINRESFKTIGPNDLVLIASREHRHDHEILKYLLQIPCSYIGLVSSKRKWRLLKASLLEEGYEEEALARVHAPVGLDIAAQTVAEIATSIVAEMIAIFRGKKG